VIYGNARVPTYAQDFGNHLALSKAAGCNTILRERITGAHTDGPRPAERAG